MKKEIEMFLSGKANTGLLLTGKFGMPLKADASYVAAKLLSTTQDRLILHPDFLLLEKSEKEKSIGVEALSDVFTKASLKPAVADRIVILIDGIDLMTEQAQNKLLKTLEENQSVTFLACAYSASVIDTVKSRMRIIEYTPYTELQFLAWCEEHNRNNGLELFFATGGIPGLIEEYEDVLDTFVKISKALQENKFTELFQILHLVKEKDWKSFYSRYPELVPNLLQYMGKLLQEALFEKNGVPSSYFHNSSISEESLMTTLNEIELQLAACRKNSYQKDSFFLGIIKIVESLGGSV